MRTKVWRVVHPSKRDEKNPASQKVPRPPVHSALDSWKQGAQLIQYGITQNLDVLQYVQPVNDNDPWARLDAYFASLDRYIAKN